MGRYDNPPDTAAIIQDLQRRLSALERTRTIVVGSGAPATTPPDGAQYGDSAGSFYYLRLGGAWKKVAVAP